MQDIYSIYMEKATLAAGCFWCTEAVFQKVKGVTKVTSGYSGGTLKNPTYEEVCTGDTGHVECVQIEYDNKKITYEEILEVYWKTHNPHQKGGQGADVGSQYQSVIFYHDTSQKQVAKTSRENIEKESNKKVYTLIRPFETFYEAEEKHQNFYEKHPWHPYCLINIKPKLKKVNND